LFADGFESGGTLAWSAFGWRGEQGARADSTAGEACQAPATTAAEITRRGASRCQAREATRRLASAVIGCRHDRW
jgi:hypothetical protein